MKQNNLYLTINENDKIIKVCKKIEGNFYLVYYNHVLNSMSIGKRVNRDEIKKITFKKTQNLLDFLRLSEKIEKNHLVEELVKETLV